MRRGTKLLTGVGSVVLFVVLLVSAGIDEVIRILADVDIATFGLAVGIFLVSYPIVSVRWAVLHRSTGVRVSVWESFEIVAISYGFNQLLPANSGDLARSKIAERYVPVESHGELVGLVGVERLADVGTICSIVILSIPFGLGRMPALILTVIVAIGALAVTVAILAVAYDGRVGLPMPDRVRSELGQAVVVVGELSLSRLVGVVGLSALRWAVVVLSLWLVAAAMGVSLPIGVAAVVIAAMSLTAIVPLSPGGIGPVDAVGAGTLVAASVPYTLALSLVVLQRSLGLGLMAVVGVALYNYRLLAPPLTETIRED